jgi:hypothetical protein
MAFDRKKITGECRKLADNQHEPSRVGFATGACCDRIKQARLRRGLAMGRSTSDSAQASLGFELRGASSSDRHAGARSLAAGA